MRELELLLAFSKHLHRLPNLPNGHEIGMMEIGFEGGKTTYGPFWMTEAETDQIARDFLKSLGVIDA